MDLRLEHRFYEQLPELAVLSGAQKFSDVQNLVVNETLATELGLDVDWLRSTAGASFLTGQTDELQKSSVAQIYAGHQFGGYSPRLGDGRAVLLGERRLADGRLVDLHLKGSGRTPLSRGDGYATLGSALREYLMSEAMHAMGVSSTRTLGVTLTGNFVGRDGKILPGAVVTRVASSHVRVGSFQYAAATGDENLLERLLRFTAERHFSEAIDVSKITQPSDLALAVFRQVLSRQADLIASWMLVGFVHGVMNTDNMTVSGETIDYGPCAFLDVYDELAVFSSIDREGRYAFGKQPLMAKWNLARFAETLVSFLAADPASAIAIARTELERFDAVYEEAFLRRIAAKVGLERTNSALGHIAAGIHADLKENRHDPTKFFAGLAKRAEQPALKDDSEWEALWLSQKPDPQLMRASNPLRVPRGRIVDGALERAEDGDMSDFLLLLEAVKSPFEVRPEWERFDDPLTGWENNFVTYCGT